MGSIFALILLLIVASFFVDEPLRRKIERKMNDSLKGYSVTLPKLHFNLFGFSLALRDLTVRQQANPEPPVMFFPYLKASVQWRELLSGHVVSDFLFERPRVHINLTQLRHEARDPVPIKDEGWQQALEAIYPFKINLFRVVEGDVVYLDEDLNRPLHLAHVNLRANNIRNIHSRDRTYPSPVHLDAVVFEKGEARIDGHADFLAEPYLGLHTLFHVNNVPLDRLRPVAARSNLQMRGGVASTHGEFEFGPKFKALRVDDLQIRGLHVDYVHTLATAPQEQERKRKVGEAVKKASNKPGLDLRLVRFRLTDGEVALVNRVKTPAYRLYISGADLEVRNFSNQLVHGPAEARLSGRFLDSGPAVVTATFRPSKTGQDFDLNIAVRGTDMTRMNDLFRAYGKFDVSEGVFSLYSKIQVAHGRMDGWVKPLFQDVKVYDPTQDKDKNVFQKLYEIIVGGVARLLENRPRKEVATVADISGPLDNPNSSTWQIIGRLLENAFIRAILPGFEHQFGKHNKQNP